jgi:hypothetical protein
MSSLIAWIGPFYVVPFIVIASTRGWRSLGTAAALGSVAVAALWTNHLRHAGEGNGFAEAMALILIAAIAASVVAATVGRTATLIARHVLKRWQSGVVLGVSFLAPLAFYPGYSAYADWTRRPPSAECSLRTSFPLRVGNVVLYVPKTPATMVQAKDDIFPLELPSRVRELCAAVDRTREPLEAQTVTLFVQKVLHQRQRPGIRAWLDSGCRAAPPVLSRLVCAPDRSPVFNQMTLYGPANFPDRVTFVGVAPTYEFYQQRKTQGEYRVELGETREGATVYSDGTWVINENAVITCSKDRYSYGLPCRTDIPLPGGLNAKVSFDVQGEDVASAFRNIESVILALYKEWST